MEEMTERLEDKRGQMKKEICSKPTPEPELSQLLFY